MKVLRMKKDIAQLYKPMPAPEPKPEVKQADPFEEPKTKEPVILSRRIGEVLANPASPRWLEKDVLERNVIAVLSSKRGDGKTTWATDRIMHVAVNLGEPVVCLWGEGNAGLHFEAWLKKHAPDVKPDTLPVYIITKRFDLTSAEGRGKIHAEMARITKEQGRAPSLLVTDTWAKWVRCQEKDNSDVAEKLGGIDTAIRSAFDCTVLLITHLGHGDQTRARGASALEADTDAAYILTKDPSGIVRVTRERFKDCAEMDPLLYKREIVDLGRLDEYGRPVTSVVFVETKDVPKYQPKQQQPSGENQIAILEVLKELCPFGDAAGIDAVLDATLEKREIESTHTTRRDARKALDKLAAKRLMWADGELCGPGAIRPV